MADRLVYKNTGLEFLDSFYSEPKSDDEWKAITDALAGSGNEIQSFIDGHSHDDASIGGDKLAEESTRHYEQHWLGGAKAGEHFDRVLRRGYEQAIALARADGRSLPIKSFFVTGAGNHDCEAHIHADDTQVTVFLFLTEMRHYGSTRARSKSVVVRAGTDGQPGAVVLDAADAERGIAPIHMIPTSGTGHAEARQA